MNLPQSIDCIENKFLTKFFNYNSMILSHFQIHYCIECVNLHAYY